MCSNGKREERTRITAILENGVCERLLKYAEVKGQTKTMALERLLTYDLKHIADMEKEIKTDILIRS